MASLFHISIEHQITTCDDVLQEFSYCFTFQQSIKSQLNTSRGLPRLDCFTFQQSIKSQLVCCCFLSAATVSHFNRASNHNYLSRFDFDLVTVSHFNRASNHNRQLPRYSLYKLFHISIEHQITTLSLHLCPARYCFTFQQSIKSQRNAVPHRHAMTVSHFNRASNHNPPPSLPSRLQTVSHFNRASNHNKMGVL